MFNQKANDEGLNACAIITSIFHQSGEQSFREFNMHDISLALEVDAFREKRIYQLIRLANIHVQETIDVSPLDIRY